MRYRVLIQITIRCKRFPAHCASKWFLPRMSPIMIGPICFLIKPFVTDIAFIFPLLEMDPFNVLNENMSESIRFLTDWTMERLFVSVLLRHVVNEWIMR